VRYAALAEALALAAQRLIGVHVGVGGPTVGRPQEQTALACLEIEDPQVADQVAALAKQVRNEA
jgi:hypothetical protein